MEACLIMLSCNKNGAHDVSLLMGDLGNKAGL